MNETRTPSIPRKRRGGRAVRLLIVWLIVTAALGLPPVQAGPPFTIIQITPALDGFGSSSPSINADGTRIAFVSRSDLTGANPDHNPEIFLYDTGAEQFSQITFSTPGPSLSPSINADGTRIAFVSGSDLTGDNPDGNWEIFLFETQTTQTTQLTASTECDNMAPAINADGTRIAFRSSCALHGGWDYEEIFFYDADTGQITQVSSTSGESYAARPAINAGGTRVAYLLSELIGDNGEIQGEIYLFDTTTGLAAPITPVVGSRSGPIGLSINAAGTCLAFASWTDLTGGNPDGNMEIFLVDIKTGQLTQLTDTAEITNQGPSMSADGSYVAFSRCSDFWQEPYIEPEIFMVDTATQQLTQLTSADQGGSASPSVNADGTRVAFSSTSDLTGGNPGGDEQIFLATSALLRMYLPLIYK